MRKAHPGSTLLGKEGWVGRESSGVRPEGPNVGREGTNPAPAAVNLCLVTDSDACF
jgi:hypothetical protein